MNNPFPGYTSDILVPFTYSTQVALTGLGAVQTGMIVLDTASDFIFEGYTSRSSQDANNIVTDYFTVYIKNNTSGLDLTNGYVDQSCIAPPMSHFAPAAIPVRYAKQTQFQFNFTNLYNGNLTVNFYMRGFKVLNNPVTIPSS